MPEPTPEKTSRPLAESLPDAALAAPALPTAIPQPRSRPAAPSGPAREEIQNRLRDANLLRMRGQLAQAEQELLQATALLPGDPEVYELLGDIQKQAGKSSYALASYTQAAQLQTASTRRAALESKLARLALEQNRPAMARLTQAAAFKDNIVIAIVCSAVVPGSGQMLAGKTLQGALLLAGWLLSLIVIAVLPQTKETLKDIMAEVRGAAPASSGAELVVLAVLVVNGCIWLYSVVEGAIAARRAQEERI